MSFNFKQFSIQDNNSAMKVGVDAVLLGAWADAGDCRKVLDLGAGTGIVSLMLAQRFPEVEVDAIEINNSAVIDLRFNFDNSPWGDRLNAINEDYLKYNFSKKYDLIISNPPYFTPSESSISNNRKMARIAYILTPEKIFIRAKTLLENAGKLILIYPFELRENLLKVALLNEYYIYSELVIKDTEKAIPKRTIMCFSSSNSIEPKFNYLNLKSENGDGYSDEFKDLTKDFYL